MKQHWGTDELVEHWTLLPRETELLTNKTGATRLGFAVLLKFFQLEAYFPNMHRPCLRWRWNLSQSRSKSRRSNSNSISGAGALLRFLFIEQVAFDFGFDAPLPLRVACSVKRM